MGIDFLKEVTFVGVQRVAGFGHLERKDRGRLPGWKLVNDRAASLRPCPVLFFVFGHGVSVLWEK